MTLYPSIAALEAATIRRIEASASHKEHIPMITPDVLEITPALQQRIDAATREIAARPFGVSAAREAEINSSSLLTSDHWHAIRAALMLETDLIAVWFVDSLDLFFHAHGSWPKPQAFWYPSLVLFDTTKANAHDWLQAPWFASFPGVWAEMASGQHIRFVPKRSIADADL